MSATPLSVLQSFWKYPAFRPLQEDVILAVLAGQDALALLPTGGGKSICYQVPALVKEGTCLVISPLIALMKDQVEQLRKRGISAEMVNSGMSKREIDIALDNCIYGERKFLYVSPERLQTELLQARVSQMNVNLLAIDEAHCISQWGFDFRPAYRQLAEFRQEFLAKVPCLAVTATANTKVAEDICEQLGFKKEAPVFQQSFSRPNLSYNVRWEENKPAKLLEIIRKTKGSAIVYVRSRNHTRTVAKTLKEYGISAEHYHAGLHHEERSRRQQEWINGRVKVMVATNAFGMGIDKADVRSVVHLDLPDSPEAYYQEAGRAGRDEKKAYAVILCQQTDIDRLEDNLLQQFPTPEQLKRVYQALANYYKLAVGSAQLTSFDFVLKDFSSTYNLDLTNTYYCLKKLEEQGFIQLNEAFYTPSKVMFLLDSQGLYSFQIANAGLESIIKSLLRIYGGQLMAGFSRIDESLLAKEAKLSVKELQQRLQMLHQMEVLLYEPQRDQPQLVFLTARYEAGKLPLDVVMLKARQEAAEKQTNAMLSYVSNAKDCRTKQLVSYFGEENFTECGVCDVCVLSRQGGLSDEQRFAYRQKIINSLSMQPQEPADLQTSLQISVTMKEGFLALLKEMVTEETLTYTDGGQLTLAK